MPRVDFPARCKNGLTRSSIEMHVYVVTGTDTSVLASEAGQLLVQWNVSNECVHGEDLTHSYHVTYQLVRHLSCPAETVSGVQTADTNVTHITLSDLEDHATYNITITGVVNGTASSDYYATGTTLSGSKTTPWLSHIIELLINVCVRFFPFSCYSASIHKIFKQVEEVAMFSTCAKQCIKRNFKGCFYTQQKYIP